MVLEVLVDIRNFEPGWNAWRRRHCFSRLLVTLDLMRVPKQVAPLTESGPTSAAGTAPEARGQISVRWHAGGRERCVRTPLLELLARGIHSTQ